MDAKTQRHVYIMDRFPDLADESLKNLLFTCLYQGQIALRKEEPEEIDRAMEYLKKIRAAHPMRGIRCTVKERVWMTMSAVAFEATCRIRNFLRVGL